MAINSTARTNSKGHQREAIRPRSQASSRSSSGRYELRAASNDRAPTRGQTSIRVHLDMTSQRLLPEEERSSEAGIWAGRRSLAQSRARLSSAKLGKGFFSANKCLFQSYNLHGYFVKAAG